VRRTRPLTRGVRGGRRRGLSLIEVLVALAIFLFALVVIGRLITLGTERAQDVQQQGQAVQLCQAKLAEVAAGAVPLTSQGGTPFEGDPDWQWSLQCEQDSVPGLWRVQVRVSRQRADGTRVESSLTQLLLDPAQRGSTMDAPPTADSGTGSQPADSSSGGNTGSASSAQPSSGGGSGGSATPGRGP
jgi:type II secretion system protein I